MAMDNMNETEQAYRNGYWSGYAAGRRSAGAEPMAEDRRKWIADHMIFTRIDGQLVGVIRVDDLPKED